MELISAWYVLPIAFVLDLILGDPPLWPHPVRWMGKAIERFEFFFRLLPIRPLYSGGLMAIFLIGATWGLTVFFLFWAHSLSPWLKTIFEIIFLYYCISARSLKSAAMDVLKSLEAGKLEVAKDKVTMIVGRDTHKLGRNGVARAVVETVAENLVDGVLSPLFFALLGGAPLALAYKMINTLDSMIGYKNETYFYFGKIAARIDDVANFIPARLSVFIIAIAARLVGAKSLRAIKIAFLEGAKHLSPNAGYPEAAFAGALDIKLGGPNYYHGRMVDKPYIGLHLKSVQLNHIRQACNLMMASSVVWLSAIVAIDLYFWA